MPRIINIIIGYYCVIFLLPIIFYALRDHFYILNDVISSSVNHDTMKLNIKLILAILAGLMGLVFARSMPKIHLKPLLRKQLITSNINRKISIIVVFFLTIILLNKFRNAYNFNFDIDYIIHSNLKHNFYPNNLLAFIFGTNLLHLFLFIFVNIKLLEDYRDRVSYKYISVLKTIIVFNFFYMANDFIMGALSRMVFDFLTLYILCIYILSLKINFKKFVLFIGFFGIILTIIRTSVNMLKAGTEFSKIIYELVYFYMNRLNFTYILNIVIHKADKFYPNGTLPDLINNLFRFSNTKVIFQGNYFGRSLEIISPHDFATGIASSYVSELYINFGTIGIFLGSFVFGLYIKTFDHVGMHSQYSIIRMAILLPILLHGLESPFTVLVPAIIKVELLILIFYSIRHSRMWKFK